jgi:hypothetical protein
MERIKARATFLRPNRPLDSRLTNRLACPTCNPTLMEAPMCMCEGWGGETRPQGGDIPGPKK